MEQLEIRNHLWNFLSSVRGILPKEEAIELLLAVFVLKTISEDQDDRFKFNISEYDYQKWIESSSSYSYLDINDTTITIANELLNSREQELRALGGVLNKYSQQSDFLRRSLEFSKDFTSIDNVNKLVISVLLELLFDSNSARQSFGVLSDEVSNIVSEIFLSISPYTIYDPCVGSAKLLCKAAKRVGKAKIVGNDINSYSLFLAFARILSTRNKNWNLIQSDCITEDFFLHSFDKFEAIVTFPPINFSANKYYDHDSSYRFFDKNDATPLFIEHVINSLQPNGLAIVALPNSFLFKMGRVKYFREYLLESGYIRAVITLPANSVSNASINTCFVILQKDYDFRKKIKLIDAAAIKEELNNQSNSSDQLLGEIVSKLFFFDYDSYFYRPDFILEISAEDALNNESNLNIGRYKPDELLESLELMLRFDQEKPFEIRTLSELASITPGRGTRRRNLADKKSGEEFIPYLRVGDLKSTFIGQPRYWINTDTVAFNRSVIAEKNSLLLSIQGTIGKTSLITDKNERYFPSQGLVVIKADESIIRADYLLAYLNSSICQQWLEQRSLAGTTIKRLDRRELHRLPVLIPSIEWQEMLAKEFRKNKTDFFTSLEQLEKDEYDNKVSVELNKVLNLLSKRNSIISAADIVSLLADTAQNISSISYVNTELRHNDAMLITQLIDASKVLFNVRFVPVGLPRQAILNLAQDKFRAISRNISGGLMIDTTVNKICDGIISLIKSYEMSSVKSVSINIKAVREQIDIDEIANVSASIKSDGGVPLVNVEIFSNEIESSVLIPYLGENDLQTISLALNNIKSPQVKTINFNWSANTLSNDTCSGTAELSLSINDGVTRDIDFLDIGGSPYITGDPIKPNKRMSLYGRRNILESIQRYISDAGNVVLLEGNRRVGKSSILYHIQGDKSIPHWICVYMSLQECEGDVKSGVPAWSLWRSMASQIISGLIKSGMTVELPNGECISPELKRGLKKAINKSVKTVISLESPFADFQAYLEDLLDKLNKKSLGVVIMIDEFDKLQEGIDNGVTSPQVPENIRSLIHRFDNFSGIFTGSRRLQRLREEYWSALFGLGIRVSVSQLDFVNSRMLVEEPVRGKLFYSPEAIDEIVTQCARYPFLIQCVCNKVFDNAVKEETQSISVSFVKKAMREFIQDNEHFMYFWTLSGLKPGSYRCQLILFVFSKQQINNQPITSGELAEVLTEAGLDIDEDKFDNELKYLMELELIERHGGNDNKEYTLTIPLMAKWVLDSQDYERVCANALQEFENE